MSTRCYQAATVQLFKKFRILTPYHRSHKGLTTPVQSHILLFYITWRLTTGRIKDCIKGYYTRAKLFFIIKFTHQIQLFTHQILLFTCCHGQRLSRHSTPQERRFKLAPILDAAQHVPTWWGPSAHHLRRCGHTLPKALGRKTYDIYRSSTKGRR